MSEKTKIEIAQSLDNIGILDVPNHHMYASKLAKQTVEEYSNELTNDFEDQNGLEYYIKSAIIEGIEYFQSNYKTK